MLVVEDHEDSLEAMRQLLAAFGASVVPVRTGREALSAVRQQAPDLILCDLRMPDMDGYQFIARIRKNPALARTPAIAVSGLAAPADLARSRAAGFADHLVKPLDFTTIGARLGQALERPTH